MLLFFLSLPFLVRLRHCLSTLQEPSVLGRLLLKADGIRMIWALWGNDSTLPLTPTEKTMLKPHLYSANCELEGCKAFHLLAPLPRGMGWN